MRYLSQSSSNDPIQTCHPQILPDISCGRSPNLSPFGRIYPNGMNQEFKDTSYWTCSDSNLHAIANRKRLRKDSREVPLIKPSTDHSATQQGESYGGYKLETKFTQLESPKAFRHLARLYEGQVKQGRSKRPAASNLEESCPGVSRTRGTKCQRQTTSIGLEYADKDAHKFVQFPYLSKSSPGNIPADFTCPLGVGWLPLSSSDPDVQAAVRGWVKFIENHFPITDVKIRLKSKGLACTLIEAAEGYYLFGDDLKQGRLVSTNLDRVWTNLQGPLPIFESETVLRADKNSKIGVQCEPGNTMAQVFNANNTNYYPTINPNEFVENSTSGLEFKMEMC